MAEPERISAELFTRGALRSRVVSQLSDASRRQLGYWHKTGLLSASVVSGKRGTPRLYSWIDYSKARAAAKLLRKGLPSVRLRANIGWLEEQMPLWYTLSLTTYQGSVIFSPSDGPAYTIGDVRQMAAATLIEAAPLSPHLIRGYGRVFSADIATQLIAAAIDEMRTEGPLGVLSAFRDAVDMDPRIRAGSPIVKGTRIETEFLAALSRRGEATSTIAERFELAPGRVERALEFELAIAA